MLGLQLASVSAVLRDHPGLEFGAPALKRFKRRRANAHSPYVRFKRPRVSSHASSAPLESADLPHRDALELRAPSEGMSHAERRYRLGTNRRMRRNKPELAVFHKSESTGHSASVSEAATQWLAKRFVMGSRMGDNVPIHAHGKGSRKQSLSRAMLSQAVLYDVSHWRTSVIHGPASLITTFLTNHLQSTPAFTTYQPPASASHRLGDETLLKYSSDGGYTIDAWLMDCTGTPLGPCIVEFHIPYPAQASAAEVDTTVPSPQPMPFANDQEASAAEATADAQRRSKLQGTRAVESSPQALPQSPAGCRLSLSVHPRIAEDVAALLQLAFSEASAHGEQLMQSCPISPTNLTRHLPANVTAQEQLPHSSTHSPTRARTPHVSLCKHILQPHLDRRKAH